MSNWQRGIGALLIGLCATLGGCAIGGDGARPVLGMDGQQIDVSDPVERGRAQILTGQYGLAIDGLTTVVTRDPRNARAKTLLAVAFGQLKRFDLADRYHAEALEIDPNSVAALNNWGYSYLVRGDRARATGLLERAVAAGDDRPIVVANLALARGVDPTPPQLPTQAAIGEDQPRDLRVTQHVTLVRPAGRLMRVAPGVQLLLTEAPAAVAAQSDVPTAPLLPAEADWNELAAGQTDSRFALFRMLFALVEGEAGAVEQPTQHSAQIAALPASPAASPFGFFPEVDDFTTTPIQIADASASPGASPFVFFPDVDDFTQP